MRKGRASYSNILNLATLTTHQMRSQGLVGTAERELLGVSTGLQMPEIPRTGAWSILQDQLGHVPSRACADEDEDDAQPEGTVSWCAYIYGTLSHQ